MILIKNIFKRTVDPNLRKAVKDSEKIMQKYIYENVFKSSTMKELLSDTFEYKGQRPDTILLKDLKTGKPVEAKVKLSSKKNHYEPSVTVETIELVDKFGKSIGSKEYSIKPASDKKLFMITGEMNTHRQDLAGVGFRLDQMHIERALQLGIEKIPRVALPKAILYHTKMGFLPDRGEEYYVQIKNSNQIMPALENHFERLAGEIPISSFVPIVIEKCGKFFIDMNTTGAVTTLEQCKNRIERTNAHRLLSFNTVSTHMSLKGKELDHWKELLKDHPILSKLYQKFPEY